jgi:hypothetical protein
VTACTGCEIQSTLCDGAERSWDRDGGPHSNQGLQKGGIGPMSLLLAPQTGDVLCTIQLLVDVQVKQFVASWVHCGTGCL